MPDPELNYVPGDRVSTESQHSPAHGLTGNKLARGTGLVLVAVVLSLCLKAVAGFPLNADVAWFMSVARRMLEGEVLYRDLIDVNPPLVVYLLMPAVILSDIVGLSDRIAVQLLILAVASAAMLWHARLLDLARDPARTAWWVVMMTFVALVVPASDFAQREHFMVLLTLPFLALKWRRVVGLETGGREAYAVGATAGIGFAIKPHYLIIWLALEFLDWMQGRSGDGNLRLRPEATAAMGVLVTYAVFVGVVHPEYFSMMADVAPLYQRFSSEPLRLFLIGYLAVPLFIVLLAAGLSRPGVRQGALVKVMLVFACSGLAVALLQGKGWRYHSLPVIIATLLAWGALLEASIRSLALRRREAEGYRSALVICVLLAAAYPAGRGVAFALGVADEQRQLNSQRASVLEPYDPESILVLGDIVSDAFPLANNLGARSISPYPSFWWFRLTSATSDASLTATTTEVEGGLREKLIDAIVARPPTIVLLDTARFDRFGGRAFPYVEYLSSDSAFARIWQRYERRGAIDRFTIWQAPDEASFD